MRFGPISESFSFNCAKRLAGMNKRLMTPFLALKILPLFQTHLLMKPEVVVTKTQANHRIFDVSTLEYFFLREKKSTWSFGEFHVKCINLTQIKSRFKFFNQ